MGGESILPRWRYLFSVGDALYGITSMMQNLQIGHDPLQLGMSVPRQNVVSDCALAFPDWLPAPSARQPTRLPVFLDESREFAPSLRLVERIAGHQEICPHRKFGGAENSLII